MRFLFIHQNFPAQFRHVAAALADHPAHQVAGLGEEGHARRAARLHPRLQVFGYPAPQGASAQTHLYLRDYEAQLRRAQQVVRSSLRLREQGVEPDVVVAHPGWGEAMFLREVFPHARLVHYAEYFYHPHGADLGFDPEYPADLDARLRVRVRNSAQLVGLCEADLAIAPTEWQRSRYPPQFQANIAVQHEGIDTDLLCPQPDAQFNSGGLALRPGGEVVTFTARNLEPYRGFHTLMRSLPALQRLRPGARVVIAGGDEVSYGRKPPGGASYRALLMDELAERVDWSRVHFVGRLPYAHYLDLLRCSAVHVHLTYPFVLSWSMLEAMAAGCLVVGSDTAPVREVITPGVNGLLSDFFDAEALAATIAGALDDPVAMLPLRQAARALVCERYDLRRRCLPAWLNLLGA